MQAEKSNSTVRKVLEGLCRNNGWAYGVFWRFDQRNSLLLNEEDAFYEEHMGLIIDNMLLQVHILGSGIVGQVAFTKKHRWIFLGAHFEGPIPTGSIKNQDLFQDNSGIHHQFSSGIETVALISVEPRGVLQFGSTRKIPESTEFVNQTKRLFRETENGYLAILPDNMPPSSNTEMNSLSGLLASLISSGNSYPENRSPMYGGSVKDCVRTTCTLPDLPGLSPFTSYHGTTNSSHLQNQFQMPGKEALFKLSSKSTTWLPEPHLPVTTYCNGSSDPTLCISSITNTFDSDENKNFFSDSTVENDHFDSLELDFEWEQAEEFLNDILIPVVSDDPSDFSKNASECIPERLVSMVAPQDSLSSVFGHDQFLGSIGCGSNSISAYSIEDESAASIRRKGSSYNLEPNKEVIPKSEVGSWIGDDKSITGGNRVVLQPKKIGRKRDGPDSQSKVLHRLKKRECVAELRKLIPNCEKMSVDSLLAQTVKHMLFLRSVTKHAEKLQQTEERKHTEMGLRENFSSNSFVRGCEVGTVTMMDPVDVKDISPPGQKLIQMLCEESGFLLELVDIIQGIGLTILKGVMEVRDNKILACFIVEAEVNRHVTKQEIYVTLHQLLYREATSEINVTGQFANVANGGTTLLNNYHQPIPISFAGTLM